jgi:hypothetical protein
MTRDEVVEHVRRLLEQASLGSADAPRPRDRFLVVSPSGAMSGFRIELADGRGFLVMVLADPMLD